MIGVKSGDFEYTSLFTKMVVKRKKRKNIHTYKNTTNRNGSRNKE